MRKISIDFGKSWFFVFTIFLSAFLLFQIQPLIGKYLLPWFGGGPAVWTTCMLFFQILLLGGYLYAHALNRLNLQIQGKLHALIVISILAVLISLSFFWDTPITPGPNWKPSSSALPAWSLLRILLLSVGLPYFLLSSTSSLLQIWFSRLNSNRSPYGLYVISNIASFCALISYPILFEPFLLLKTQARIWFLLYVLYALILGYCALQTISFSQRKTEVISSPKLPHKDKHDSQHPTRKSYLLWLSLAACASVLLLATTNQMCQDVAAIPFLWILPLSVYLLSFVLGFNEKHTYFRHWYPFLLLIALALGWWNIKHVKTLNIGIQIAGYTFILFICCVVCHSELYRHRPEPQYLTSFYLMLAVGGAVGGFFVGIIAPVVFNGFWEYHLSLVGCAAIGIGMLFRGKNFQLYHLRFLLTAVFIVFSVLICYNPVKAIQHSVEMSRNFYGVLRVRKAVDEGIPVYGLMHGSIFHGMQWSSGPYHARPTDYYTETSGVGLSILNHPKRLLQQPLRIGIIGLGIGTLAAYGQPDDNITFYEIDPAVINVAFNTEYFTYLSDCKADIDIIPGDARLSLEEELEGNRPQEYDILVVDAFTSDAIPAHLLTKEAFEIYLSHLNNGGILAIHITNRHLNLAPVLKALKRHVKFDGRIVESIKDSKVSMSAKWALLTENQEFLESPDIKAAASNFDTVPDIQLWTDDYSNLYQVLQ